MRTVQTARAQGNWGYEITVGKHRLTTDAESEGGGAGYGPSPHEYLASALAACTSITLQMYAARKNWPLKGAEASVAIHDEAGTAVFERTLRLVGIEEAEQKARLLEIADRCPIHRLLSGKIAIRTTLA